MPYLFVAGITISLFLVVLLIAKPNKVVPDYIFATLLFFSGQTIFNTFWVQTGYYLQHPVALVIGLSAPIIVAPLIYLYTKYQTQNIKFNRIDFLHFLPYLIVSILYFNFYFLSYEDKLEMIRNEEYSNRDILRISLNLLSGFIYFTLSAWRLIRFKKNMKHLFSNTEKIQFNWLLFLIIGMLFIWLFVLFTNNDNLISISATIFVFLMGYFGITQVNVFNGENVFFFSSPQIPNGAKTEAFDESSYDDKYRNSLMSKEEALHIHKLLRQIIKTERPYLNPELTLGQLAKLLKIHPNKLSEVINTIEAKTFYDLINELRIKEFLRQVVIPENKRFTFMSLAYDCGFNSKASFNRNFKKYSGTTPSQFLSNYSASQTE